MSMTPEMTVSNGGHSRHIACKLCRDRKVRCGGEQPTCEKCRLAGEECVYLPTKKPTKADLVQTVETLQKRLAEAEAQITQLKAASVNTPILPSSLNVGWPGTANAQDLLQLTSDSDTSYQRFTTQQSSGPECQESSQTTTTRQDALVPFSVVEDMDMGASNNVDLYSPNGLCWFQREMSEETGAAMLEPVTAFSSAILGIQAEAFVMASVVANYISWLRKAPPGSGMTVQENPVAVGMLETLENRLRELCDVSQTRSNGALRDLVAALEAIAPPGGQMAARLASLEEQLQKQTRERAEFFRSRYSPCALLSEQSRNTSQ